MNIEQEMSNDEGLWFARLLRRLDSENGAVRDKGARLLQKKLLHCESER